MRDIKSGRDNLQEPNPLEIRVKRGNLRDAIMFAGRGNRRIVRKKFASGYDPHEFVLIEVILKDTNF